MYVRSNNTQWGFRNKRSPKWLVFLMWTELIVRAVIGTLMYTSVETTRRARRSEWCSVLLRKKIQSLCDSMREIRISFGAGLASQRQPCWWNEPSGERVHGWHLLRTNSLRISFVTGGKSQYYRAEVNSRMKDIMLLTEYQWTRLDLEERTDFDPAGREKQRRRK
jgi:hypothetical protein